MAALTLFLVGVWWIFNGEPGWGVLFICMAVFG